MLTQIGDGSNAVFQVVFLENFIQPQGKGLQVMAGHTAVSGKTLGHHQDVARLLGQVIVVDRQKSPHVHQSVLLTNLDKPGIFGKAAGIQEKGDGIAFGQFSCPADIFHTNRLAGIGIVGSCQHNQRDSLRTEFFEHCF